MCTQKTKKNVLTALELKLLVSHTVCILGVELRSSVGATSVTND